MTTVTNWGDALLTSLTGALAVFLAAIPKIIGFVVILIIGWLIAGIVARIVAGLLRTVKFNEVAQRSGFSGFVKNMGVETDASGFIATVTKWFIRLIALIVAFDALGLPAISNVLQELLLWLPNLVVALVVLVLAGLAANALSSLVKGATKQAGFSNPQLLATVASVAVWGFGIIVAVNQLGIAATLVNTLFIGLIAALALALGLAFGLGGRETAAEIVKGWYQQGQQAGDKLGDAADAAKKQVQSGDKTNASPLSFPLTLHQYASLDDNKKVKVDEPQTFNTKKALVEELKKMGNLPSEQAEALGAKLLTGQHVNVTAKGQDLELYAEPA